MGDSHKKMANLGLQVDNYPRDLLQRFMEKSSSNNDQDLDLDLEVESESPEVELNLGLSMGGRFGVEKKSKNSLVRSCSFIPQCSGAGAGVGVGDGEVLIPPATGFVGLGRTTSLPVEMEDEWRKRKEMQSLRRMEAKRRRSEKQRSFRTSAVAGGGSGGGGGGGEIEIERGQYVSAMKKVGSSVAPQFSSPVLAAGGSQAVFVGAVGAGGSGSGSGVLQGSVESQGGSNSSISELESKPLNGSSDCGEEKEQTKSDTAAGGSSSSKTPITEAESSSTRNSGKETGASSLGDMPCVFTNGDGPNGRRIEGILYKYGKGEEIRIMCVCHGSFHSPVEFIKHAGGTDLANPLKHIVVNPNSSYL